METTNKCDMSELNDTELLAVPTEILAHLLSFLGRFDRFPVSQSCKRLSDVIHHHVGYDYIAVNSSEVCSRLSGSPLLKNTRINFYEDGSDEDLSCLSGVHWLTAISNKKITDIGLNHVRGVHTIDLTSCTSITDKGISALTGVHTIHLTGTSVTDKGISALAGVHTISLSRTSVTDKGISALVGVHTIDLSMTRVTDASVLAGVHKIDLSETYVTDEGISALVGVHTIDISFCDFITDKGISALTGVHTIHLQGIENVGDSMKSLKNAHTIDISRSNARDAWLVPLSSVKVLHIVGCYLLTDKGIEGLSSIQELMLSSSNDKITRKCITSLEKNGVTIKRE